jgi:hypothetical protein|nr:MAG TPA: hypothetical protein [Caudoviricetes sp.]
MMLKKIYLELIAIHQELRALRQQGIFGGKLKKDGNVNVITEYANNEPCLEVLEISLQPHDWYKLTQQSCYRELKIFLENLQIPGSTDIP